MKTTLRSRIEKQRNENYTDLQKALDLALWLNFIGQKEKAEFGVVQLPNNKFSVELITSQNKAQSIHTFATKDAYQKIPYPKIMELKKQQDPLAHWEEILGLFSTANGYLLRFIIYYQIPLERFIRAELASRGYDMNYNWVGFEKAKQHWFE